MRFLKLSFLVLVLRSLPGQDLGTLTVYGGGTGFFPMPEPFDSLTFVSPFSIPAEPPGSLFFVASKSTSILVTQSQPTQGPTDAIQDASTDLNVSPFWGKGWRASLGSDLHSTQISLENRWFLFDGTRNEEGRFFGGLWLGWLGDAPWGIWSAETSVRTGPEGVNFWQGVGSASFDWEGHRFLGGLGYQSPGFFLPLLGWLWNREIFLVGLRYETHAKNQGRLRLKGRFGQEAGIQAATDFGLPTASWQFLSLVGWLPITEDIIGGLEGSWTNNVKSSVFRVVLNLDYQGGISLGLSGGASWNGSRTTPDLKARVTLGWMDWVISYFGENQPRFKVQGAVAW